MDKLIRDNFASTKSEIHDVDFTGNWENEHKSTMAITSSENGIIQGSYKSKVGKPEDEETFDLIGFSSGDLISFSVNFGKHGSLTSWSGQLTVEEGIEKIKTLWHLATNVTDDQESDKIWSAIWSGADNFRRI